MVKIQFGEVSGKPVGALTVACQPDDAHTIADRVYDHVESLLASARSIEVRVTASTIWLLADGTEVGSCRLEQVG